MLRKVIARGLLIRETYLKPSVVELEKIEYDKLVKATRRRVSDVFYSQQSKIENAFIGSLNRK